MRSKTEFILMASLLMSAVAMSIDLMLPAMADMALDLGMTHSNQRQWVISILFVGLGLGQLLFGPLSDSIGRRKAIFMGSAVFIVGSLVCLTATSFEAMILGRFLQGFGAAGPRIVTVALIRDRFEGAAMASIMSVIMGVFILVPVLAPGVGQLLLFLVPWRGLFMLLAFSSLSAALWIYFRQPETLPQVQPFRMGRILRASRDVLTHRIAMSYTVAGAFVYGSLMGYIISSQQLLQEVYDTGPWFAVYFGVNAAFVSAATLINSRLVKHFDMQVICKSSMIGTMGLSGIFGIYVLLIPGLPSLWLLMVFNGPLLFLLGLTFGNFNAIALKDFGHVAGLATAVISALMTLLSMSIAASIGASFNQTPTPVIMGYFMASVMALLAMTWASKHSDLKPKKTGA